MSNPSGLPDHILVLGDEAKSARATQRLLLAAGFNCTVLASFDVAQEYIRGHHISLIILEPAAPRIAGALLQANEDDSGESIKRVEWARQALRFCEEVRAGKRTAEVPILVLSKSQRAQDKVACLNTGANDFLSKPYQRAELLSRVRAHLRLRTYERERAERYEELTLLHMVSTLLASSLEPDVLLRGTLSILARYLSADGGVAFFQNPDTEAMGIVAAEGFAADSEDPSWMLNLYARLAPLMKKSAVLLDPGSEEIREGFVQTTSDGISTLLCAPLGLKGNNVGAICLLSKRSGAFSPQQSELLSTICNQLTVALENARLYVETRKSASQLSFVYNLGNNLMTSLEMDELLGYAVFTVGKSLECDICAVVVRNSDSVGSLASAIYVRSHDDKESAAEWYHRDRILRYLDGSDLRVQPAIEIRSADRFLIYPETLVETAVPLMFDDKVLGLLICGSSTARPISYDDQKLLGAVAQQLSLAIRNTELYRRTKDTSINLAVEVSRRTREAEEQKRFTEKIIDSLPVSLYVVDRDMRIVAWNRNREVGGLGINREQVLGKNVFQVLARQPRRILENEFTDVFRTGEMVRMEQESWFDGQKKVWKISKIPMRVDNAEVTHVITVGEDVTEQKKMNEAVIHAEKLASIGRLAAGVVHEINNPLATIAACSEALTARLDDLPDTEMHQDFGEYLQIIREEAFRCKTITNSLLEFSHQRQADKMPSNINQVIEQTLQLIRHHPKLGKMNVVKELDFSLIPVYVNEGQMKQVFIALMSNAFDAMESDGTLTIRTHWNEVQGERGIAVEFTDTGIGIPAEHLAKIFDPFFTTKPLGRGTGLGLSVCYGIVSEHGGAIEVDSTDGKGSTFRVLLPVHDSFDAARAAEQTLGGVLEMESAL
jgi:two-component system, NtrC family, sensor kinase